MTSVPATSVGYTGYLLQGKLTDIVRAVAGGRFEDTEVLVAPGTKRRHRWDMVYIDEQGVRVAVEFDGDDHYRDSMRVKADRWKDEQATAQGVKVVRVPYWVQLTDETAKYYFGWDITVEQDFAHGYIVSKLFPASYCELGIARFERELAELPPGVRQAVINSLKARIGEHGIEYVLPTQLRGLAG